MYLSDDAIHAMRTTILDWYAINARSLPWRETTNPYYILVSEIMLQQTQVVRVVPKYHTFLSCFPTPYVLANAPTAEVITHWSGLGFNRRALNLQRACQDICDKHKGCVPTTYEALLTLPGVGTYTAGAVMAFAYNADVPVVDINIKRVHIAMLDLPYDIHEKEIRSIVSQTQPPGQARVWYNALMDYGAEVLHAKRTGIRSTPQSPFIGSRREGRGKILKYLTCHTTVSRDHLITHIKHPDASSIVDEMIREGFITQHGAMIALIS